MTRQYPDHIDIVHLHVREASAARAASFKSPYSDQSLRSPQARLNKAAGAADAAREVNRDVIA